MLKNLTPLISFRRQGKKAIAIFLRNQYIGCISSFQDETTCLLMMDKMKKLWCHKYKKSFLPFESFREAINFVENFSPSIIENHKEYL